MAHSPGDTLTIEPRTRRSEERRYLLVLEGASSSVVPLPATGAVVIGRAEDADLRLRDGGASRQHAVLTLADGTARVADLDSHNGTWVNGARIDAPRTLISGDEVAIGETRLLLYSSSPSLLRRSESFAEFRARLQAEIQRCQKHDRCVSLCALGPSVPPNARIAIDHATAAALRSFDVASWDDEGRLLVLLPEDDGAEATEVGRSLVRALASIWPAVRAGLATCPTDGCDGDTLISTARRAAAAVNSGEAGTAQPATTVFTLGENRVAIAEPAMIRIYELIRRLAGSEVPVLVCGETGVGKDAAAYAVHAWSARARRPFVSLNCAAIPETLVESELFGHEKGAFSGAVSAKPGLLENADGGTLFLDEIGDLSAAAQGKLLRAIETKRIVRIGDVRERKIDMRVVAATNRDLAADVKSGRFRQDLYFRLGVATVLLPPLRERPRELPMLARMFLDEARVRAGRSPMAISPSAMLRMATHNWPGNVRELKHVMEYAAAAAEGETVELAHLPEGLSASEMSPTPAPPKTSSPTPPPEPARFRPLADELRDFERRRIAEAIDAAGGYQNRAAELLGMPLRTFYQKVKQYGLGPRSGRTPR